MDEFSAEFSLYEIIEALLNRTDIDFSKEVIILNDGDGEFIDQWNIQNVPEPDLETLMSVDVETFQKNKYIDELRIQRNNLLRDSDYLVLPDVPIIDSDKSKITKYRQDLRDFFQLYNFNNMAYSEVIVMELPNINEYEIDFINKN